METRVIIENGEVVLDAVDGVGQECRHHHSPYIGALKKEFGLSDAHVKEDCKPEMQLEQAAQDSEGEKLA